MTPTQSRPTPLQQALLRVFYRASLPSLLAPYSGYDPRGQR